MNLKLNSVLVVLFLMLAAPTGFAADPQVDSQPIAELISPTSVIFDLSSGNQYTFGVRLNQDFKHLQVKLMSGDNDLIKTFSLNNIKSGNKEFSWDGKDDQGVLVPDEAYIPVITGMTKSGQNIVVDPRETSGGGLLGKLNTSLNGNNGIRYSLTEPARVLIRAGIKGGPLMNTIVAWAPRAKGTNIQAWNGFDQSGVQFLPQNPDLRVLVIAYALADGAIITTGNEKINYLAYRKQKNWPASQIEPEKIINQRDGQRISPYYFLPRSLAFDPKVLFSILDDLPKNEQGHVIVSQPVNIRVDLSSADEWLLQQSQYEISFFVDYKFIAEEETGYTPLTWQWDPSGIAAGEHVLTVNISGLWGHVGVHNIIFEVAK